MHVSARVESTLDRTPRAPAKARELVRKLPLSDRARQSVELIVTELITNSVVHTPRRRSDGLWLTVRCETSRVSGEVCDPGGGFEWQRSEPDLTEPGGLGLLLVDQLASNWGIRSNGDTCVWFECADC